MSYTALARRYRSQAFDDVVGQEPIAQTLKNAIATDRLHHAYLFTGTRGVGKTSMARLFARALNAPDTIADAPKPPGVEFPPKDVQQRMADAIMRGDDMNVIEIDGASNRSVEDARQLIANANLAPSGNARFKVYIIDEVHMLTKDAFNTLLKVMEEPPSHLKFILATTEPHKVLPTIHSRCQRFDFRNIPTAKIVEHLRDVLKQEKLKADDAVLFQVARLGNGSMRDALSLLDRLLAAGDDPLTEELLERMLGVPDRQLVATLVDAIADSDVSGALKATDELLNRGIAQDQLITVLIDHLRNLMLISAAGADSPLVELDETSKQQAAEQAKKFHTAALVHMIALLENLHRNSRSSPTPRALLDAVIVRLSLSEKFADLAAMLAGNGGGGGSPAKKSHRPPTADLAVSRPAPIPAPGRSAQRPQAGPETPPPDGAEGPGTAPGPARPPLRFTPRPADKPAAPVPGPGGGRRMVTQRERDEVMNTPLVRQVADLFDAKLVDVRDAPKPAADESANDAADGPDEKET